MRAAQAAPDGLARTVTIERRRLLHSPSTA
jgi:hypothetical protein